MTNIHRNDYPKGSFFYTHRYLEIGGKAYHTGLHKEATGLVIQEAEEGRRKNADEDLY